MLLPSGICVNLRAKPGSQEGGHPACTAVWWRHLAESPRTFQYAAAARRARLGCSGVRWAAYPTGGHVRAFAPPQIRRAAVDSATVARPRPIRARLGHRASVTQNLTFPSATGENTVNDSLPRAIAMSGVIKFFKSLVSSVSFLSNAHLGPKTLSKSFFPHLLNILPKQEAFQLLFHPPKPVFVVFSIKVNVNRSRRFTSRFRSAILKTGLREEFLSLLVRYLGTSNVITCCVLSFRSEWGKVNITVYKGTQ